MDSVIQVFFYSCTISNLEINHCFTSLLIYMKVVTNFHRLLFFLGNYHHSSLNHSFTIETTGMLPYLNCNNIEHKFPALVVDFFLVNCVKIRNIVTSDIFAKDSLIKFFPDYWPYLLVLWCNCLT